jgi:predicted nucleotidyltransferase
MDVEKLLQCLNAHRVRYVIIGATAFPVHGFSRVTFERVWRKRVHNHIGKASASFASLSDLIKMKKAAGRVKDLEDLRVLKRLLVRKQKAKSRKTRNGHR